MATSKSILDKTGSAIDQGSFLGQQSRNGGLESFFRRQTTLKSQLESKDEN